MDNNTALYIFGAINLVFFGICFGTLIPIYIKSTNGIRTAASVVNFTVAVVLIDTLINMILFIVQRDHYVEWCISTSDSLNLILENYQLPIVKNDFYNCNRAWQDELKFTILSTLVMILVYGYWAISLTSYSVKLRIKLKLMMVPMMGSIMPTQGGPMVTGTEIVL
ncbi:hypothetical protein CU098_007286 [Rhizopus stolonifer]|uniref:Uncharacterized protein n=1 Tax=Rhizopus stolonifer TaxID=4846 RepID=A0A367KMR4_RHIST|nr:hypothetical protein CU098_007286 [Rhizopus stolonifer]